MDIKGKIIGMAFTGSFCTYKKAFTELRNITHNEFDNETIFLQYDDNKLSIDSSIHSIKCKHGTSEENPLTKNIEIEYQRLK